MKKPMIYLLLLALFSCGTRLDTAGRVSSSETKETKITIFDVTDVAIEDVSITPQNGYVTFEIAGNKPVDDNTPRMILRLRNGYYLVDIYNDIDRENYWDKIYISAISVEQNDPVAIVTGKLGTSLPNAIELLKQEYPQVKFLLLHQIPGGIDMEAISMAMLIVREHGYGTAVMAGSTVESAGADLFMAGLYRWAQEGAKIGVHNFKSADGTEFEGEEPITYLMRETYKEMGIDDEFYHFMRSIPAEQMLYLTPAQLRHYNITNVNLAEFEAALSIKLKD